MAQCKRCGSTSVAWVQSSKAGKWYLAFTTRQAALPVYGPDTVHITPAKTIVHEHILHKCDDASTGGRNSAAQLAERERLDLNARLNAIDNAPFGLCAEAFVPGGAHVILWKETESGYAGKCFECRETFTKNN